MFAPRSIRSEGIYKILDMKKKKNKIAYPKRGMRTKTNTRTTKKKKR